MAALEQKLQPSPELPSIYYPALIDDRRRIDLTSQTFVAIDPFNPGEVDDAIFAKRRRGGGFLVQAAIADSTPIASQSGLLEAAIAARHNTYYCEGENILPGRTILPEALSKQLELRDGVSRALVISREFSADMEPAKDVMVLPGLVRVATTNYLEFGWRAHHNITSSIERPLIDFAREYKRAHQLRHRDPRTISNEIQSYGYAFSLVQNFMVLANVAFSEWATQTGTDVIHRQYHRERKIGAQYDAEPGRHDWVARYVNRDASYSHATSPLRRAPDTVNQLQAAAYLSDGAAPYTVEEIQRLSDHFNAPEIDQEMAEAA